MKTLQFDYLNSLIIEKKFEKFIKNIDEKEVIHYITSLFKSLGFSISKINDITIAIYASNKLIRIITVDASSKNILAKDIIEYTNFIEIDEEILFSKYSYFSLYGHKESDSFFDEKIHRVSLFYLYELVILLNSSNSFEKKLEQLSLYNHNIFSYEKASDMLDKYNRAVVIQPTGTGKMYVAINLMQRFRKTSDAPILFISSNRYVLKIFESFIDYLGISDIDTMTYQKLYSNSDSIKDYGQIYIDEFHRSGSKKWYHSIAEFLMSQKDAQIIGTTATPVRTEGFDMANSEDSFFDGRVSSEMYLLDAIAKGILPVPKYITGIYSINDEVKSLIESVENADIDSKKRKEYINKIQKLRTDWNRSSGIDTIIAENIDSSDKKYIIFCEDISHMNAIKKTVVSWFKKSKKFTDVKHYSISHDYKESYNSNQISKFNKEQSGIVNLLFTVNKINEGVHFENISGIIGLRRIMLSQNLFYQQIGRAFSAYSAVSPKIFDLSNNYQMIKENTFTRDLNKAIETENVKRRDYKMLQKKFISIDTSEKSFSIFEAFKEIREKLQKNLYEELVEFSEKYKRPPMGNRKTSKDSIYENSLFRRFSYLKKNDYQFSMFGVKKSLSQEQISHLKSLGFNVKYISDREFFIETLVEFYQKNNREPNKSSENFLEKKLAKRYLRYRKAYFNKSKYETCFTDKEVQKLKYVGYIFENLNSVEKVVKDILDFYKKYDRVPNGTVRASNVEKNLYKRFIRIKEATSRNINGLSFNEEQVKHLKGLGLDFSTNNSEDLKNELISYYKKYNEYPIHYSFPKGEKEKISRKLSSKMYLFYKNSQNDKYKRNSLFSLKDIKELESFGFVLYYNFNKEKFINKLFDYIKLCRKDNIVLFKNIDKPVSEKDIEINNIIKNFKEFKGRTLSSKYKKELQFTEDDIERLKEFDIHIYKRNLSEALMNDIIDFYKKYNRMPDSSGNIIFNGKKESNIYLNFGRYRRNYFSNKKGTERIFSQNQIDKMIASGIPKKRFEKSENKTSSKIVEDLIIYAKKHKKPLTSSSEMRDDDIRLLYNRYITYKKNSKNYDYKGKNKFGKKEIKQLNDIGYNILEPNEILTEELVIFMMKNKRIPLKSKSSVLERRLYNKMITYSSNTKLRIKNTKQIFNTLQILRLKKIGYNIC